MYRQNNFKRRRAQEKRHFAESQVGYSKTSTSYPFRLNFYNVPPQLEITIDDFEQWAIDRMRVLGEIESRLARNFAFKDIETSMKPIIDKYLPLGSNSSATRAQQRRGETSSTNAGQVDIKSGSQATFKFDSTKEEHKRLKDHYSHFILRLAFCRSEELRRRFINAEAVLFKIRYNSDELEEREAFIETCNLSWERVTQEEKQILAPKLKWLSQTENSDGSKSTENSQFFKVDFEMVPDLVESRKVVLHMGKALVPMSYHQSFILAEFSSRLERALVQTIRALPRLEEDDRLVPLLNHLSIGFQVLSSYDASVTGGVPGSGEEIRANMIDNMVDKHFPICMQTMQKGLLTTKHLRYNARLQYGNFLKWIGLSVDEALQFWRSHFNVSEDQFNKEYKYNIRHQYGLEGSRRNYKPHSCVEIVNGPPPARGEYHGCPFRTFSKDNLTSALQHMGITDEQDLSAIRDNVSHSQYHIACTRVYELTHRTDTEQYQETITHPNQYFERSWKHSKKLAEKQKKVN